MPRKTKKNNGDGRHTVFTDVDNPGKRLRPSERPLSIGSLDDLAALITKLVETQIEERLGNIHDPQQEEQSAKVDLQKATFRPEGTLKHEMSWTTGGEAFTFALAETLQSGMLLKKKGQSLFSCYLDNLTKFRRSKDALLLNAAVAMQQTQEVDQQLQQIQ